MQHDDTIIMEVQQERHWGLVTSVNLYGCDPQRIRDPQTIKSFVAQLSQKIELARFGETAVVNLGSNLHADGYSVLQFLESSLISGHFSNISRAAYFDILSTEPYPPYATAEFCKSFFAAENMDVSVTFRYDEAQPFDDGEGDFYELEYSVGAAVAW